jgi:hypothetical protein
MTYYDLTIDKYLQIKEALENAEDDLNTQVTLLSIINECTEDELLDLPLPEYHKKVEDLAFLSEPINPRPNCPKTITIDKEVFESVRDVKKFTAGQYIDYNSLIKSEDFYQVLPNILACFFIPKGKDYGKDYDIMEVAKKIRYNVSIGLAMDVCFFFQKKSIHSINRMLDYLVLTTKIQMRKSNKETKEKLKIAVEKIQQLRDSFNAGLGSTTLTQWLKH